ncbi:MAG: DUF748 domain-containing protein [Candidatus Omnitrophota bacterium]|nr:MAG: DUF748 domain-containing protein [Candidatus Omnitrophota bacterium]
MRTIRNFIFAIIIIGIIGYAAGFAFVNIKGKEFLTKNIKKNCGVQPQIESVSLEFPTTLTIENFTCGDVSFKTAKASILFFNPVNSRLILNSLFIDNLHLKAERKKDQIIIAPFLAEKLSVHNMLTKSDRKESSVSGKIPSGAKMTPIMIRKLSIKDASSQIVDSSDGRVITFTVKDVHMNASSFSYPELAKSHIQMKASLETKGKTMTDVLNVKGWVDYVNKDMKVELHVNNFDYLAFSQYYPPFWKPDNLGIKEAYLSLKSDFVSADNDLVIDNTLTLEKIDYIEAKEGEEENPKSRTLQTILAFLQGSEEKPFLRFRMKTKMDDPQLDFSVLQDSLKEAVPLGPALVFEGLLEKVKKGISGGTKGVKDIANGTVETIKEVGEEIVDTLKEIFVPEKDEDAEAAQNLEEE